MVRTSNSIDVSLGGRLREKRISSGLSAEQLAEELQVPAKDIQSYETGAKRIPANRLLRLAKLFNVKPVYFFGFDESTPTEQDEPRFTLSDQGLRLHRAFIGVRNPMLREAIVSLVAEMARNEPNL